MSTAGAGVDENEGADDARGRAPAGRIAASADASSTPAGGARTSSPSGIDRHSRFAIACSRYLRQPELGEANIPCCLRRWTAAVVLS